MPAPEKITDMPVIAEATVDDADLLEIIDLSAVDNLKISIITLKKLIASFATFEVSVTLDAVANNTYLRHGVVLTNQNPIVFPFDVRLIAMASASQTSTTWDLELRESGILIPGAVLSTVTATKASVTGLAIDITALTEIQAFVNGLTIQKPVATLFFARRS